MQLHYLLLHLLFEHKMINRSIENAQRKVEGHNFDIRKNWDREGGDHPAVSVLRERAQYVSCLFKKYSGGHQAS